MRLAPEETARFYRVWLALLHHVNAQRQLVPAFSPDPDQGSIPTEDALRLRDVLWADDALREQFVAANPAGLPPADLALVASWRHRLAGNFFIERCLQQHAIFLSEDSPPHAYGVLGLASSFDELVGPLLPVHVRAVLLPFEDRIIFDSLLRSSAITFGPGIRRSLRTAYRDAKEREGIITTLLPAVPSSPAAARAALQRRNRTLLAAFGRELARAGLGPSTAAQHVATMAAFADNYLLRKEPPSALLELRRADLESYLTGAGRPANRVSFRRFARFLYATGRLDYEVATDLASYLKRA
ncbi:MAG TPA: hypothetical protein VGP33_13710 [Chloroflexota bacterium]|nr:hypothetical protein [Chloroflexota bacterium]